MRVIDGAAFMPMGNTDTRPIVVEFPGASLMSIEVLAAEQFIVRCPGCRASQLFALPRNGSTLPAFLHTSVECPIHRRIETLTRA
jgi:hypothetical protein